MRTISPRRLGKAWCSLACCTTGLALVWLVSFLAPLSVHWEGTSNSIGLSVARSVLRLEHRRTLDETRFPAAESTAYPGVRYSSIIVGAPRALQREHQAHCGLITDESEWVRNMNERNQAERDAWSTRVSSNLRTLEIGLWALLLLPGIPSASALTVHCVRRSHRRKLGRCLDCAYDLSGNESSRCPECGTLFNPDRSDLMNG